MRDPVRPQGSWIRSMAAVAVRPSLWPTAVRLVADLARPGWITSWPPVPTPDPAYVRFRMLTAYGDERAAPAPSDTVTYLEWCRSWRATIAR